MKIQRLDHLVLTVKNIDATCKFYAQVLGMKAVTFSDDRRALVFGEQKINLHEFGNELEPKADHPTPGSGDLCFIADTPIAEVMTHVKSFGIDIFKGPVKRAGAKGTITSIYFRDTDGNLIEVANG